MIFYFTAAGDSLYLARELEDHPVSIAQAIHDPGQVFTDRQIGIVCGLVDHRLPVPVAEFLERFRFETEYFYFILIGTQQWNAALQQQAEALGVTPVYWRTVQIAGMDSSVVGKQLQSLRQDLKQYRHCLLATSAAQPDEQDESPIVLRLRVSAACIGCGICERICPRGCYTLLHQRSHRDPRRCVGCLACVHGCPTNALQPEAKWRSETARYHNEHIRLKEIIQANDQQHRNH